MTTDFYHHYRGRFSSALRWPQLDALWHTILQTPDKWYIYLLNHELPQTPAHAESLQQFIREIDVLLRKEHEHDYCGIVYADSFDHPSMVKIFDPHHLGSSCGSCGYTVYPRWLLSRLPPQPLEDDMPLPANRRRWWQSIFG
jgi:hypothetical protein